jgi:hypothetical protein
MTSLQGDILDVGIELKVFMHDCNRRHLVGGFRSVDQIATGIPVAFGVEDVLGDDVWVGKHYIVRPAYNAGSAWRG